MTQFPPGGVTISDERGSALVSALLILLLLTVLAAGGFWLAQGELAAAQGYSQSVRALYVAEGGLSRYFASAPIPSADSMVFEYYENPCEELIGFERTECEEEEDNEGEDLLEEFELRPPPSQVYAFTDAQVYITSRFVISDGRSPIYEVTAEARVQDRRNPNLWTMRAVDHYAELSPPFDMTSVFTATGGISFAGVGGEHYHFDGQAKAGKTGSCGTETDLDNMMVPSGQWSLPLPHAECPSGKGCPYKWHQKGDGATVDSSNATGSGIITNMGLDWADFLNDDFYAGVPDVIVFTDAQDDDFEAYFAKDKEKAFKSAPSWPITRFNGTLTTDVEVKGFGLLVITGDLIVTGDEKLHWTGLILVGGNLIVTDEAHIHVKGGSVTGLSCTDAQRAAGLCRDSLGGEHVDMKYRPCEVSQAWSRTMYLRPMADLFRESGPNS